MEKKKKKTAERKTTRRKKKTEVTSEEKREIKASDFSASETSTAHSPESQKDEKTSQILWAIKTVGQMLKEKAQSSQALRSAQNLLSMAQTMLKDKETRKFMLQMAKTTLKSQLEAKKQKLLEKIKKEK